MRLRLRNRLTAASAVPFGAASGLALLLSIALAAGAQNPPAAPASAPPQSQPPAAASAPAQTAPASAQTTTAAPAAPLTPAQQRSVQLAADTAQLQQLAAELKAAMDKSSKDTLSFTVIKKAQEVEKLARKVHDEMRASLLSGS